jgi:CRP-like cAMP-binding protein/di/tricarboxylate transporter
MSIRPQLGLEYADTLARVDLFAGLDRVTLAKLAAHLEPMPVDSGAAVVRQGDPGDAFYLVVRGTFGIYVAIPGRADEKRVNTLGPGAPFGEMALLSGHPRSATVRADEGAEVLRLDRGRFLGLVGREPQVALAIAGTLCERLRQADARRVDGAGPGGAEATQSRRAATAKATPATPPRRARRPSAATAGVLLAVGVLAVTWLTPPPPGLTPAGWRAIGTLVAAVPLLALDALPEGVLALALAAVWVLGGIAPVPVALGGFASTSWVLLVSVLVVGAAIASSGLLYRLALWIVAHTRGGFAGQVLALALGGVLIGPAVPNATGRVTLIAPALGELVEALGYAAGSRPAAGLAMATLVGFGQMVGVFLTSSTTAVLVYAVLPPVVQQDVTWATWAAYAAPASLLIFLGLVAAVIALYRPRAGEGVPRGQPGALALQRALLGPPSREERLSLAVGVGLLVGFTTQPLHGIQPGWIAVLALTALAATGVVNADTLRTVNWSFALLFGTLASLSAVCTGAGVDRWVAGMVASTVQDLGRAPVLFVAALTVVCFAVSLLLRWQAAAPLLTIALAPVAASAGINPFVVGLVTVIACNGFLLPYQSTTYLALYHGTGGRTFTHRQARPAAVAYVVVTLLALCASVPLWRAMGLL